ncbi:unnamed protein product [Microthlaspi erraticum]|uniref:Chromo domain-containing protein n=1 Tax=Microthlaspi erraticum TaxID=1685480 RepID=A0A6D2IU37_9BRAS|nr:unnamed protein product [Microthlaspi erraticum]
MKNNAEKKRRDLQFEVGAFVFLKLRPYRQQSVTKRVCQKLAARYYGPYEVLAKIGASAYRLRLPSESKIHPVFHVSQLKPVLGQGHVVNPLPSVFSANNELIVEPESVLDSRYNDDGHLEVLLSWKDLPDHEKTWVRMSEALQQFPDSKLGDKLRLRHGGIDKPLRGYIRKKRKENAEKGNVQTDFAHGEGRSRVEEHLKKRKVLAMEDHASQFDGSYDPDGENSYGSKQIHVSIDYLRRKSPYLFVRKEGDGKEVLREQSGSDERVRRSGCCPL